MKKTILLLSIFIALGNIVFGQTKEITGDEFRQALRPIYDKFFEVSYRSKSVEETFENGKLKGKTETISEFIPPNKYHFIVVEKVGEKSRKSVTVIIDRVYYCKKDDDEWIKSQRNCSSGDTGRNAGPDAPVSSKFTFEETKLTNLTAKLYQEYLTYNFPAEKLSYSFDKYWINNEGFLLRREIEYGSVEPKFVRSKQTDVYEYNPKNLKIEVPIK